MESELVDFIIIGSMKCGTNALFNILRRHPALNFASMKEPNFFCESITAGGTWHKGDRWYRSLFGAHGGLRGEASTCYSKYPYYPGVVERIFMKAPHARLIYIIRNPIHRSISHYLHNVLAGRESRTIRDAILSDNNNIYVDVSRYCMQLDQYRQRFISGQMLILRSEELWNSPSVAIERACNFLGVQHPDVQLPLNMRTNRTVETLRAKCRDAPVNPAQAQLYSVADHLRLSKSHSAIDFSIALGFSAVDFTRLSELLYADVEDLKNLVGTEFAEWQQQFQNGGSYQ